jgi:hypothetical protein
VFGSGPRAGGGFGAVDVTDQAIRHVEGACAAAGASTDRLHHSALGALAADLATVGDQAMVRTVVAAIPDPDGHAQALAEATVLPLARVTWTSARLRGDDHRPGAAATRAV